MKKSSEDPISLFGLNLFIPNEVYFPAEDTELCINFLMNWLPTWKISEKKLWICEIGIGSGVLSLFIGNYLFSHKKSFQIIGVDIDPIAVETSTINAKLNNLTNYCTFLIGNLFEPFKAENLQHKFDLILFNPPYLADDPDIIAPENKKPIDNVWNGGVLGSELTIEFIKQAKNFIKPSGDLLFISSSLTEQKLILKTLEDMNFKDVSKEKVHFFFEDIIMYHRIYEEKNE